MGVQAYSGPGGMRGDTKGSRKKAEPRGWSEGLRPGKEGGSNVSGQTGQRRGVGHLLGCPAKARSGRDA